MTGSQVARQRLRKPLCYCLGTMASRVEGLSENVNIKTQKTLTERFCEEQFFMKSFFFRSGQRQKPTREWPFFIYMFPSQK